MEDHQIGLITTLSPKKDIRVTKSAFRIRLEGIFCFRVSLSCCEGAVGLQAAMDTGLDGSVEK